MKKAMVGFVLLFALWITAANADVLDLTVETPEGLQTLHQQKGRYKLVHFWARWCAPCVAEMKSLDVYAKKIENSPLVVLPIAQELKGHEQLTRFYQAHHLKTLKTYRDPNRAVAKALGVTGLPATLILDEVGNVVARKEGALDWTSAKVQNWVQSVINEDAKSEGNVNVSDNHSKVIIIGSGPAGYTAAIYAARANLSPMMIAGMEVGGQLMTTTDVENFPGFRDVIQGPWLMDEMKAQAEKVGTKLVNDHINRVDFSQRPFKVWGESGTEYTADTVIISTGAQAKWLGLETEDKFKGFGVSGCATCDGFFFRDKEVVVIGGGDTAVEEAIFLTNFATKVTLVHRRDTLRAEKIMQKRLFENPKVEVVWNSVLDEVVGQDDPKSVTGVKLKSVKTGEIKEIKASGVFIAIGHKPATKIFEGVLDLDEEGYISCPPGSVKTNISGVFAAGDVQDKVYRQAVTAAGQGCMAALDAEKFISSQD